MECDKLEKGEIFFFVYLEEIIYMKVASDEGDNKYKFTIFKKDKYNEDMTSIIKTVANPDESTIGVYTDDILKIKLFCDKRKYVYPIKYTNILGILYPDMGGSNDEYTMEQNCLDFFMASRDAFNDNELNMFGTPSRFV